MTEREYELALLMNPVWEWLLREEGALLTDSETVDLVEHVRALWRELCMLDKRLEWRRAA